MITRTGYYINHFGDPSVGLFDQRWELKGEFVFDDQEEEDEFISKTQDAFELVCGERVGVESFEVYGQRIDQELQANHNCEDYDVTAQDLNRYCSVCGKMTKKFEVEQV